MKAGMVRIELRRRIDAGVGSSWIVKTATAVYRPANTANDWAKEKNAKLDFYGDRYWVVCDDEVNHESSWPLQTASIDQSTAKKVAAEFYAEEAIRLHKRAKTFENWAKIVDLS